MSPGPRTPRRELWRGHNTMHSLGFIGTGTITSAIVRGLKSSALGDWPILLSPRSQRLSAELAGSLEGVRVAAGNQAVIDGSDIVFLAVLPQDAADVLKPLRFAADKKIISLIAGLDINVIRSWTGVASITRAIPLPFVEQRCGVTPILPPDAAAAEIFGALGGSVAVTSRADFDSYATASALMSSYFGFAEIARDWLTGRGIDPADSELYLRNLFGSLGDTLRQSPLGFSGLRTGHATAGGLNELAFATFTSAGGAAAVRNGLDAVLSRLEGNPRA